MGISAPEAVREALGYLEETGVRERLAWVDRLAWELALDPEAADHHEPEQSGLPRYSFLVRVAWAGQADAPQNLLQSRGRNVLLPVARFDGGRPTTAKLLELPVGTLVEDGSPSPILGRLATIDLRPKRPADAWEA